MAKYPNEREVLDGRTWDEMPIIGEQCNQCANTGEDLHLPMHDFHGERICQDCYDYEVAQTREDAENGISTYWFDNAQYGDFTPSEHD